MTKNTPSDMLYIYKNQIRQNVVYCCSIWAGATHSSLSSFNWVQNCLKGPVRSDPLRPLSNKHTVSRRSLLFSCHMFGKPQVQTFTAKPHHATCTESNQPHSPRIPIIRMKFYSDIISPCMWNRFLSRFFLERYSGIFFQLSIYSYLSLF